MIRQSANNAAQTNQLMSASQEVIKNPDSSITEINGSMKEITAVMALFKTDEGGQERRTPRKRLPGGTGMPAEKRLTGLVSKKPRPDQIIPLEEGGFKDF